MDNKTTMTTIKIALIAAVVALIVSAAAWGVAPVKSSSVTYGNTSTDGSQAILPNPSNFDYLVGRIAIGLGTNVSNSNTGAGNINLEGQRMALVAATTTPCAILNPLNATSSVTGFTMNITTSTSTAISLAIGTSTTAYATSTTMETAAVAAGAQATITWDPGVNNAVIGPGQYIVAGNATGQVTYPFAIGGTCQATFQSV